jgi:dihydroorotase
MLRLVAPYTAKSFARALVMPNLTPPVASAQDASKYRERIKTATSGLPFMSLMTIKLLPHTDPETIVKAFHGGVVAAKLYPRGVTTNAADGIFDLEAMYPVFQKMESCKIVLCIHAEMPDAFCINREVEYLPSVGRIARVFPRLRIVVEHVSTAGAVEYVRRLPSTVAATITLHHLLLTLDDVVGGSLKPHNFCKPIAKRPKDRDALLDAALSGNPKFFFGSDSAPHDRGTKECAEGCAGIFTAPVALQRLVQLFDEHDALDKLEPFISEFGARFYNLPLNEGLIELAREPWIVPAQIGNVIPFLAGETIEWSIV